MMPSGLGSFPIVISLLFASREPRAEIIGTLTSEARRGGNEIQRARSIWGGKISKKKKTGQKKENRREKKKKTGQKWGAQGRVDLVQHSQVAVDS